MALPQERVYTIEDIYALPEGQRAELIDGRIFNMAPPGTNHQRISHILAWEIENYIRGKNGNCEVFNAPFAVFLNKDNQNYVEPDISVICDKDKIDEKGCNGAPDWVIEIISPGTQRIDYGVKLFKYRTAGVREYWIVNPITKIVQTYCFKDDEDSGQHTFDDPIQTHIFDDLTIRISDLLQ